MTNKSRSVVPGGMAFQLQVSALGSVRMLRISVYLVLMTAAVAIAESSVTLPALTFAFESDANTISSFDKDFFKKTETKASSKRHPGDELNYNTAQRQEWIAKCENEKQKGMTRFRECFAREKKAAAIELEKRLADVNARFNSPYENLSRD